MPLLRIEDLRADNAEQLLGLAQEISGMYDQWGGRDHAERPPGIHASEISGCARRAFYTMLGTQKMDRPDPMWRKKFRHGHWVHAGTQADMHDWANSLNGQLRFQDEVPISPYNSDIARQFNIYSSCDGIFTIRVKDAANRWIDAVRVGLEIKTASPAEYEKLSSPKEAHVEQVHTYMACLDVPCFWLLYYNKGNENTTPSRGKFFIPFQHGIWDKLAERFNHWLDLLETNEGVLPDREVGIGCEWCDYRWTCQPKGIRTPQHAKSIPPSTVTARKHYGKKV